MSVISFGYISTDNSLIALRIKSALRWSKQKLKKNLKKKIKSRNLHCSKSISKYANTVECSSLEKPPQWETVPCCRAPGRSLFRMEIATPSRPSSLALLVTINQFVSVLQSSSQRRSQEGEDPNNQSKVLIFFLFSSSEVIRSIIHWTTTGCSGSPFTECNLLTHIAACVVCVFVCVFDIVYRVWGRVWGRALLISYRCLFNMMELQPCDI